MLRRFFYEEQGQDLIEYALLCAFIGIVGILAWTSTRDAMTAGYGNWDSGTQRLSGCTPDPGGGGC